MKYKQILKKICIVLGWLIVWQLLALAIHNNILLAGPYESLRALFELVQTGVFWLSILYTSIRIILGFVIGMVLGLGLAIIAYKFKLLEDILQPLMSVLKSVPVVAFIIIILIWIGPDWMCMIIVALVVMPIAYLNMLNGLKSVNVKMLELAKVYNMSFGNKAKYIFMPVLKNYLYSAFELAIGMAWKSGVAAEVVGQPLKTIGDQMYLSKVYLATPELFAWTFITVVLAFLTGKLCMFLFNIAINKGKYVKMSRGKNEIKSK